MSSKDPRRDEREGEIQGKDEVVRLIRGKDRVEGIQTAKEEDSQELKFPTLCSPARYYLDGHDLLLGAEGGVGQAQNFSDKNTPH